MATTPEDVKKNASDYEDAFNDNTPPAPEQTEDEAFGLGMDVEEAAAADAEQTSGDGAPLKAVVLVADGEAVKEAAGEAVAEDSAAAAAESQSQENADEPTDPKDIQRKKSWEGRLKAEEARLAKVRDELEAKAAAAGKSTEDVASDALERASEEAEAGGDMNMAEKVEDAAEKVESGELSAEDAMKALAEDFGEPFVKMISAIAKSAASATAAEKMGALESTTSDIIDDIKETKTRAHFQAIEAAHPDFVEVGKDPMFNEWKAADPERERIAASGSAAEINAMLAEFKAQGATTDTAAAETAPAPVAQAGAPVEQAADDSAPDDELDAAEGVRSAGMQLPEEPAAADDYAGAWEEFAAKDRRA